MKPRLDATAGIAMKEKIRLATTVLVLSALALLLLWPEVDGRTLDAADSPQYERIAFNLLRYGEFNGSAQLEEERKAGLLKPYTRREPGYALYLAAVFATFPETWSLDHVCISDSKCEPGAPLRRGVQQLSSVLGAATVVSTFVAVYVLAGSWPLALVAGLLCLMLLPSDIPSLLAGFFLLIHGASAVEAWRRPRILTGVISGISLGLLVLTKAVFQYWLIGVALAWMLGLWREVDRRRSLTLVGAALLFVAWGLTVPWMIRNYIRAGEFGISGRGGEVLAIRAEYGRMTWSEVGGAFAYYLPVSRRYRIMRWLEPSEFGYARFDRKNPHGFYSRVKSNAGDVAARADLIAPGWRHGDQATRDSALTRAAVQLIREDWLKHAVLTLAFAEQGASFSIRGYARAAEVYGGLVGIPVLLMHSVATPLRHPLLPGLALLLVLAWHRREFSLFFVLLPVLYGFSIHAAVTHFIPRYSASLVPILTVIFALAAQEVWLWSKSKVHGILASPKDSPTLLRR